MHQYKTAWGEREIITEQVQEWLDAHIIEPSDSEWAFPVVLTKKKNSEKLRLCVDFRSLNKNTELQSYPMMDMDLSAFLQMRLTSRTQEICTFICHEGAFKFLRCPFGLSNIPLVFSRLMDMVFKGIKTNLYIIF